VESHHFEWRGWFADGELAALHAAAFGHPVEPHPWRAQVARHSLGWVTARAGEILVGFVNVPWDGGEHAFVLDTIVSPTFERRGIGTRLVAMAADGAARAGCQWLHVDFDEKHRPFYLGACGFASTPAGLLRLAPPGAK
jgi:GNAT superfamily N-acetyltransferase